MIILFPQMKKVLTGECFVDVEEVKQKPAEALKGSKIGEFKNFSEQWKKHFDCVLHQMESNLKVTDISTCKNTQFFISKFCFGGPLSHSNHNRFTSLLL